MGADFIHDDPHPLSGQVVCISGGVLDGQEYRIEDWWDRLGQGSWKWADGNPACLDYAIRSAKDDVPMDDEVVYGKIGAFGKLVHVSQLTPAR